MYQIEHFKWKRDRLANKDAYKITEMILSYIDLNNNNILDSLMFAFSLSTKVYRKWI